MANDAGDDQSHLMLTLDQRKVKLITPLLTPLKELKGAVVRKFGLFESQPFILEYYDNEDFQEWFEVDHDYKLPQKGRLRVQLTDTQEKYAHVSYCTKLVSGAATKGQGKATRPEKTSAALVEPTKLWQKKELRVFLEDIDEKLQSGDGITKEKIVGWAKLWSTQHSKVPKFVYTNDKTKADIRVSFETEDGCWSKIGKEAEEDKSNPSMNLALEGCDTILQQYLVVHEFGHALGLYHEHQRSDFWDMAYDLLDIEKMKDDLAIEKIDFDTDMGPMNVTNTTQTSEYDAESIMHYWFRIKWLKNLAHMSRPEVMKDTNLSDKQRRFLDWIHKWRFGFMPEKPSCKDLEFLEKCYGGGSVARAQSTLGRTAHGKPFTEKTLSEELETVIDWYKFGVYLDIPTDTLSKIRKENPYDIDAQKFALFKYIVKQSEVIGITWEKISEALVHCKEGNLALKLKQKYCS